MAIVFANEFREEFGLKTKMTHAERKELEELEEKRRKQEVQRQKNAAFQDRVAQQKGQFLYERKEKQKLHSQRKWQHSCSQLLCGSVAEDHRDHSLRSDYLPL